MSQNAQDPNALLSRYPAISEEERQWLVGWAKHIDLHNNLAMLVSQALIEKLELLVATEPELRREHRIYHIVLMLVALLVAAGLAMLIVNGWYDRPRG